MSIILAGRRFHDAGRRLPPSGMGTERIPGPSAVWLVRHGESVGNVADAQAQEQGAGRLELDVRDPDVPLSETGCSQAQALGRWMAAPPLGRWRSPLPEDQPPRVVVTPPFPRALRAARLAAEPLGLRVRTDERLR